VKSNKSIYFFKYFPFFNFYGKYFIKNHEIDSFDFTSFFGWDFLNFSDQMCMV